MGSNMTGKVMPEGEKLIERWERANDQVKRCERALNSAQCEAANSKNALAKWMLPADFEPGEKISVWYGKELIQVTAPDTSRVGSEPKITKRRRAK